jgi:hypothetical protein
MEDTANPKENPKTNMGILNLKFFGVWPLAFVICARA